MRIRMSLGLPVMLLLPAAPTFAADVAVTFVVPKVTIKTYRKPYVAVWLEDANGKQVTSIKVFYDQHRIGGKWLPELKTWWRRGGRAMDMPADGISSPTRAPGRYTIPIKGMKGLKPGRYTVAVEAAREKGGREIVKVPFTWKPQAKSSASASGKSELGKVTVVVRP